MKRFAFKLLVFLLLIGGGAIINVAVVWGCAMLLPLPRVFMPKTIECPSAWPAYLQNSWPAPASAVERVGINQGLGRFGASIIVIKSRDAQASAANPITNAYLNIHCFGFPWRSMQFEWCGLNAGERSIELLAAARNAAGTRDGIDIPGRQGGRRLPLTALWPGFAINTIFYAAIVWALFAVPGYLKRRRRIKRGLCARCAYPVGTNEKCTECGAAVRA